LQQVEAILIHELAHIKRSDYLLNLGVTALELFFFFNPFSRLLIRAIKRERENRCDDLVLQFRYDPPSYVAALLSLARGKQRRLQQLAMAAGGGDDQFLLQRVRRMLRQAHPQGRRGVRLVPFFLMAGLLSLLSLSHPPRSNMQRNPSEASFSATLSLPASYNGVELNSVSLLSMPAAPTPAKSVKPTTTPAKKHITASGRVKMMVEDDLLHLTVQSDDREYSITPSADLAPTVQIPAGSVDVAPIAVAGLQQPYVPGSSFSFRIVEDTCHPEQQIAFEQVKAVREMEMATQKAQVTLAVKLKALRVAEVQHQKEFRVLQVQLLDEQRQLQKQLRLKQQQLLRKVKLVSGRLTIVYI
jgi:hypothetical protein